jgi:glycosyltransferase involved in cell wall biosynthesis
MKVALVHDFLTRFGGAERVLLELAEMFPEAPIYTFLYDEWKMGRWFKKERVQTSFLQKFPSFFLKRPYLLWPFYSPAIESFDLREYDLIISSSSIFSKGVITRPKAVHICYAHSVSRFAWDYSFEYLKERELGFFSRFLAKFYLSYFRLWDRASALRPDHFLANSRSTARRLKKYYGVDAKVIYPPVELLSGSKTQFQKHKIFPSEENFIRQSSSLSALGGTVPAPRIERFENRISEPLNEYFLIVSQLTPYKKIDVAVEAFNKLELPLLVIGEGPQKEYLKKIAGPKVKILGWKSDEEIAEYMENCVAFIFPGEDDFGMAPVEAMSLGKPVLALARGGAQETVLPGITGELFEEATVETLADGVRRLRKNLANFSPLVISKWAERFSRERFRNEVMEFIKKTGYN